MLAPVAKPLKSRSARLASYYCLLCSHNTVLLLSGSALDADVPIVCTPLPTMAGTAQARQGETCWVRLGWDWHHFVLPLPAEAPYRSLIPLALFLPGCSAGWPRCSKDDLAWTCQTCLWSFSAPKCVITNRAVALSSLVFPYLYCLVIPFAGPMPGQAEACLDHTPTWAPASRLRIAAACPSLTLSE